MSDLNELRNELTNVVRFAKNLQSLLTHFFDWLVRKMGYINIGIWLMNAEGKLQLAAYLKYSNELSPALQSALKQQIFPLVKRDGTILQDPWYPYDDPDKGSFKLLAINCVFIGDTLGVIVLFVPKAFPFSFTSEKIEILEMAEMIFSHAACSLIQASEKTLEYDEEAEDDGGKKPKKKRDPADWWKNGGPAPY